MTNQREIKFRAKILKENQEDEKVELLIFNLAELAEISKWYEDDGVFYVKGIPLIIRTIQQFTGLKDKNGKKIYFGDILKAHFPGNFVIEEDNYDLLKTISKKIYSVEVIGNIYSNPELLK